MPDSSEVGGGAAGADVTLDAAPSSQVLAMARTIMANERTVLAFARTSIGLLASGLALLKIYDHWLLQIAGYAAIIVAVLVFISGTSRYLHSRNRLASRADLSEVLELVGAPSRGSFFAHLKKR